MPIDFSNLRGLKSSDRSNEEQKAINQVMGYREEPERIDFSPTVSQDSASSAALDTVLLYQQEREDEFQKRKSEKERDYSVGRNSINSNVNSYLDNIAKEVSSYYKKYYGTDKLPLDDDRKKQLAAEYDARKDVYGEDSANIWLDNQFKDIVGENQSWWEQALNGVGHLIPAIEGAAIQAYGYVQGALDYAVNGPGENQSIDLNWWDGILDAAQDNPVTRYGRDVEHAGASNVAQGFMNLIGLSNETAAERIAATKATATRYNPEGIGADMIVTTEDQDNSLLSSATPWQALQSGGFTAWSMLAGAGEAKLAGWLFNSAAKGASWLNATGRAFKTAEGLEKALVGLKRAQNATDIFVIPGAVGSMEGAMEGLSTKIEAERKAVQELDDYYKGMVAKEAQDTGRALEDVWKDYEDDYNAARRQIEWASAKAGIHNFYANSLINGVINQTLKAGIMAPRVQETLRNSKLFGWAYKNPKFRITPSGEVAPKGIGKAEMVARILKEPFGEGIEEYSQSLSNDVFSAAAENNIDEFIKNRFEGDGTAKIADTFGSDYAAALTALNSSLTDKESIQSAILGAVSSVMGTATVWGRGYHRDDKGNLVRNSLVDPRNFTRGLDSSGNQESWEGYLRRVTPWRSGAVNAYYDAVREQDEALETAATLTEWLKNPANKAKWDGLTGTANWITQMQNAAESNDQFSYRKAQMGNTVNDIFMLQKLEGTDFYETVMKDLQKAADGELSEEEIQKMKEAGGEDYQNVSDQEIVEKVQSNANRMLGLMTQVEQESKNLDRLLGRVDEDTKQSLIFGKLMEQDFRERSNQLKEEINAIAGNIEDSRESNISGIPDGIKSLILRYGSVNKALKAAEELQSEKEKTETRIKELNDIDSKKQSNKQKEDLVKSKDRVKAIDKELESFNVLKDNEGNIDSSWSQLVLSESDIMALDPITRAVVLSQGAARLYNATHQNRRKVDLMNLELNELDRQIEDIEAKKAGWMTADGRIKKHHNRQVTEADREIEELQKQKTAKMRELDAEQGKMNTKSIYSSQQQAVIDSLVQQGMAYDPDFIDKTVDIGRLEKGIKDYHTQYQAILSDPNLFQNYVNRAKYKAHADLIRRRAEMIAGIEDFEKYSQEIDRLTANESQSEVNAVMAALRHESDRQKRQDGEVQNPGESPVETNYDRYMKNVLKQNELVMQFAKNPELTDNDQSLLIDAMQYLASKGVDITDREAAVQVLVEKDEQGNVGGKFRQWVEAKNSNRLPQQRAFMPVFTSIGQVVGQYVELINGRQADAANKGNINPVVQPVQPEEVQGVQPAPTSISSPSPTPTSAAQPQQMPEESIFTKAYSSPEGGQIIDNDGTVATGAQTAAMRQRQQEQTEDEKSELMKRLETVMPSELARTLAETEGIIQNSNMADEVKRLASDALERLLDEDETYSTIDDLLDTLQSQINNLKSQSDTQEKDDNDFNKAAGLLSKVYASLNAKKIRGRRRTLPLPSSRPVNPKASLIHSANIAYLESKNPDAWAVRFTNDHAIDEWNREHIIGREEPVYFITDSDWTAEVTSQMNGSIEERGYDTLSDMPVVAAIKVDTPQDTARTTAIEVNGQWYQPICVMPGSKSKTQGAARVEDIRRLASKEQGRHLITENGNPNGNPLITYVSGDNYLHAHHPDQDSQKKRSNAKENNTDVINSILMTLPRDSEARLRAMSRQNMLNDPEYQEARSKFINSLDWNGEGSGQYENQLTSTPDNFRDGGTGNPMIVFTKPMAETVSRESDKTLPEVLRDGSDSEVVTFNSRTERLFNEVIRPLFVYLPMSDKTGDRSARLITRQDVEDNPNTFADEAERLTKALNGYTGSSDTKGIKGINDFIYIKPAEGWSIKVTAPEVLQTIGDFNGSESVYKIYFVHNDPQVSPVEIGEIRVNADSSQDNMTSAMWLLRNIMWDSQNGQVRGFLNWQVPKADAQNLKNPDNARATQAKRNYAAIIDDGILTYAGSSLVYDIDGIELKAPVSSDGQGHTRIVYPYDKVTNADNAKTAASQNITPQADGAVNAKDGSLVQAESGIALDDRNSSQRAPQTPVESEKLKKAKELTKRIIEDSKQFRLSEDETYYYIKDNVTGDETRYLRVTIVISADESASQWTPSIQQIYDKLKERHALADLDISEVGTFKDIRHMSMSLGIPVGEIRRAVAELRTVHKKEKYGAWGIPSTAIGNTFDLMTRDFLAGHLKETYPNVSEKVRNLFIDQLTIFKNDLDSKGIHIVSEGVMAHGEITMTDAEGNTHNTKVAGTLDLFGYNDNGDFYIFDMKTTRNHSDEKLEDEKSKWSRQISMYADLLKQKYGIEIAERNLRIIPINVNYPAPEEYDRATRSMVPVRDYRINKDTGKLQVSPHGREEYKDYEMPMPTSLHHDNGDNTIGMRKTDLNGQFQPGYTSFNINWDNLSSEDQDIASALITQTAGQDNGEIPVSATIDTPQRQKPSFIDMGDIDWEESQQHNPAAPPIVPQGQTDILPAWDKLSMAAKGYLAETLGYSDKDLYNEMLNNPDEVEAVRQDLACHGLL